SERWRIAAEPMPQKQAHGGVGPTPKFGIPGDTHLYDGVAPDPRELLIRTFAQFPAARTTCAQGFQAGLTAAGHRLIVSYASQCPSEGGCAPLGGWGMQSGHRE